MHQSDAKTFSRSFIAESIFLKSSFFQNVNGFNFFTFVKPVILLTKFPHNLFNVVFLFWRQVFNFFVFKNFNLPRFVFFQICSAHSYLLSFVYSSDIVFVHLYACEFFFFVIICRYITSLRIGRIRMWINRPWKFLNVAFVCYDWCLLVRIIQLRCLVVEKKRTPVLFSFWFYLPVLDLELFLEFNNFLSNVFSVAAMHWSQKSSLCAIFNLTASTFDLVVVLCWLY